VAEWPEPEADPEESRRWWGRVALAGAVGAGVILLANSGGAGSWRLPEFELPSFDMPELSAPDLRGRETPDRNAAPEVAYDATDMMPGEALARGEASSQPVAFEDCVRAIEGAAQAFGPPSSVESTPVRRVASYKTPNGFLTVTCANGMMSIEPGL
jgi:hypothetical protein